MSEAKNQLSALLELVKAGETVLITDRGTPVARLEAVSAAEDWDARMARLERAGLVRRGSGDPRRILDMPLPKPEPGAERAVLDALLEERRTGR